MILDSRLIFLAESFMGAPTTALAYKRMLIHCCVYANSGK